MPPSASTASHLAHHVHVLDKTPLNHNVDRWIVEKPEGYTYTPGQATELAIDRDGCRDETRPFTLTNLPTLPYLEFTIKRYPSHDGVTDALGEVEPGANLLIGEPFGAIHYAGPGTFIAGGAGLTPFLAIFRQLEADHELAGQRLIFANEEPRDVFMRSELDRWFGRRVHYLVDRKPAKFTQRRTVDRGFLTEHITGFTDQHFYLCGPPGMGPDIRAILRELGVDDDRIVHEDWS